MPSLLHHIFGFFQNFNENVQNTEYAEPKIMSFWMRKLNYASSSDACEDEEVEDENDAQTACTDEADVEDDQCDHGESVGGEDFEGEDCPCEPSRFARKMKLVSRAAKYGMREGAFCGVFFGGGWGIYKWIGINYLGKEGGEGGSDEDGDDDGSTTNTNLIFVTAANSAIAMGVICAFLCCTKAIVSCN